MLPRGVLPAAPAATLPAHRALHRHSLTPLDPPASPWQQAALLRQYWPPPPASRSHAVPACARSVPECGQSAAGRSAQQKASCRQPHIAHNARATLPHQHCACQQAGDAQAQQQFRRPSLAEEAKHQPPNRQAAPVDTHPQPCPCRRCAAPLRKQRLVPQASRHL